MASFNFTLDSFQITDTRSQHKDTDYVSFTLRLNNLLPVTHFKQLGNLNNGVFNVGLTFNNVPVVEAGAVAFNYLIFNAGNASALDVQNGLTNLAGDMAVGEGITNLPGFSSALTVGQLFFAEQLRALFRSGCDGMVAAEQNKLSYSDIAARALAAPFHQKTNHVGPGIPKGCNSRPSNYIVNWHMAQGIAVPPVEGMNPGEAQVKIRGAGLSNVPTTGTGPIVSRTNPPVGQIVDIGSGVQLVLGTSVS
jgi:hypothetical protein